MGSIPLNSSSWAVWWTVGGTVVVLLGIYLVSRTPEEPTSEFIAAVRASASAGVKKQAAGTSSAGSRPSSKPGPIVRPMDSMTLREAIRKAGGAVDKDGGLGDDLSLAYDSLERGVWPSDKATAKSAMIRIGRTLDKSTHDRLGERAPMLYIETAFLDALRKQGLNALADRLEASDAGTFQ